MNNTQAKLATPMRVQRFVKELADGTPLPLPAYDHEGDSGLTLYATKDVIVKPFVPTLVPHGIGIELAPGYDTQITPRSSALLKKRVHASLGTIDNPYRGELASCLLYIPTPEPLDGDRFKAFLVDKFGIERFEDSQALQNFLGLARLLGEFGVVTVDQEPLVIKTGERVTQLVARTVVTARVEEVEDLAASSRGAGGWGSTGG